MAEVGAGAHGTGSFRWFDSRFGGSNAQCTTTHTHRGRSPPPFSALLWCFHVFSEKVRQEKKEGVIQYKHMPVEHILYTFPHALFG